MTTYARIENGTLQLEHTTLPVDEVATTLNVVQPPPIDRGRGCAAPGFSFLAASFSWPTYIFIATLLRGEPTATDFPIALLIALGSAALIFAVTMIKMAPKSQPPYFELNFYVGGIQLTSLSSYNYYQLQQFQESIISAKGTRTTINIGNLDASMTYGNQFNGPSQIHGYNNRQSF